MKDSSKIKIPQTQTLWETHKNSDGEIEHLITSNQLRQKWFGYNCSKDGTIVKVITADSPKEINQYFSKEIKIKNDN